MLFAQRLLAIVLLLLLIALSIVLLPFAFVLVLLGVLGQKIAELVSNGMKAIVVLGKFEK